MCVSVCVCVCVCGSAREEAEGDVAAHKRARRPLSLPPPQRHTRVSTKQRGGERKEHLAPLLFSPRPPSATSTSTRAHHPSRHIHESGFWGVRTRLPTCDAQEPFLLSLGAVRAHVGTGIMDVAHRRSVARLVIPPLLEPCPPPRSRTSVSKQGACSPVLCHPSPPLRQWIEREHGMKAWEEGSSHTGAISRPHAHTHPHFATTASLSTSPLTRTRAPSHSLPPCLSLFLALAHRGPRAEKHTHTHTSRGKRPSAWGGAVPSV